MQHSKSSKTDCPSLAEAKDMLAVFLGSFPTINLREPEIYITQLCCLITSYPMPIVSGALEQGLRRFKFPPSMAELRDVLEERAYVPRYVEQWENDARKLASERLLEAPLPAKEQRPTYDELKAKYGPSWGLRAAEGKKEPFRSIAELKAEFGEIFDRTPNR